MLSLVINTWMGDCMNLIDTHGHMQRCQANFTLNDVFLHVAVMGTLWNERRLNCEWHKLLIMH